MGFIADLLGRGAAGEKKSPRTIDVVQEKLSRVRAEKQATRARLEANKDERARLLLQDDTDAEIEALDREYTHLMGVKAPRLEEVEALLLSELESLRDAAKRAQWRKLRSRIDTAASEYAEALGNTLAAMNRMRALHAEAAAAGFSHEMQSAYVPPARAVGADDLARFQAAIERAREAGRTAS